MAGLLCGCGGEGRREPRPETLEPYVRAYVDLVEAGDEPALRRHLNNEAQPTDASARIRRYGGRLYTDVRVSASTEFPRIYSVVIQARSAGEPIRWQETLEWTDDGWTMGPLAPGA